MNTERNGKKRYSIDSGLWAQNLSQVYRFGSAYLSEKMKEYGLSAGSFPIVLFLADNGPSNLELIADALLVDKSLITRQIRNLLKKDLISIASDTSDKRKKIAILTEFGKAIVPQIRKVLKTWGEEIFASLSREKQEVFFEILEYSAEKTLSMYCKVREQ
ncbi:MAG: MarR family winged helix-turn-helix transcriptional regulator [Spirochaetia bacterium]